MIEFCGKYIEIQIHDTILTRDIVHIGVDLVLVLYTDHIANEPRFYRREDIVANIAGEICKIPRISFTQHGLIEIEEKVVFPEIGVFIDMDEFESSFY